MIKVFISKTPDLSFLLSYNADDCDMPFFIHEDGQFHWLANNYITQESGGPNYYGVKPKSGTIIQTAQSLARFLNFMYSRNDSELDTTDNDIFEYCKFLLSQSNINPDTCKKHIRTSLKYLIFIQSLDNNLHLITSEKYSQTKYQVHITIDRYIRNNFFSEYIQHESIKYLSQPYTEVEMIYDDEFYAWVDAINCTTNHPILNELISLRWEAMSYLLEATGSRISELHQYTRKMIKDAYLPLADANQLVELNRIPVVKGKYAKNTRKISIANGTIQQVIAYINEVEKKWPDLEHDQLFVDLNNGNKLSRKYFQDYTRRVIEGSKYAKKLAHVSNHSFRHRFITYRIAEAIDKLKEQGNLSNLLKVAAQAVMKLTLHANERSLSTYVHLAMSDLASKNHIPSTNNTPQRLAFYRINELVALNEQGRLNDQEAIKEIKFALTNLNRVSNVDQE
ncbi:site-specific integrase [uncultured Tolumonas sp.]|uniref:site-specific integrase n=1 Tax=uncultured Tolumonas sp. TaxID=263765 RepID=UPI00293142FA|nr:site-specific integrase [uncultured Tolumonas sp.]